jgi:hypothetical protein
MIQQFHNANLAFKTEGDEFVPSQSLVNLRAFDQISQAQCPNLVGHSLRNDFGGPIFASTTVPDESHA